MIRGRFIGIDRFSDPVIHDLSGCVRDATALHALFKDGIDGIDAELITNDGATIGNLRRAVAETLEVATDDDAVILTFATHGTHDHRIVAADTVLTDLDKTAYSLDDLVSAFRASNARFAFVILDCCFAGAAPARVVSETPTARAIFDLQAIEATGKVILAASRMDEEAYEHPNRRHGLLTAALTDALIETHPGLLSLIEAVMSRVYADAAGMGVRQHPVATTYADGPFSLPVLRRGATFAAAFPEYAGVRTADVLGIKAFGIPDDIVSAWADDFDNYLHPLQLDSINEHRVLDGRSLLVVAPTSSGKTFIAELAAIRAILDGRKAVFLLPYKALVSEKFEDFSYKYGERLGLRVIRCNSDYRDQISEFVAGKFDIAVFTYEMFLGVTVGNPSALNLLGLVVLDEGQFITDPERGITVELILTFLRLNRARGIAPQLVILSAVLGNIQQFKDWLDIQTLSSSHRPVPLEFGVLDRSGVFQFRRDSGEEGTMQLLAGPVMQRREKASAQDLLVPLVQSLLQDSNERVLVFRNRRGQAEGSATYLARDLGLGSAQTALESLPRYDLSTVSSVLQGALKGGVAFHDSNLNAAERAIVERFFRDHDGGIRVLTSTSGLAAGINTPASTAIIVETTIAQPGNPPMPVGDVRNMAGRAGRFGYQETGRAVILCDTPFERDRLYRRYVTSPSEEIRSSFDPAHLSTWLIRLLRQVTRIPRPEVPALLLNTFGGYLATRQNPQFEVRLTQEITGLLGRMLDNQLLDETADGVSLTMLGAACGESSLSFESCLRLIESLRRVGNTPLSPQALLAILQLLPEGDAMYVPMQRRGTAEGRFVQPFATRFGAQLASELQRYAADQFMYWARAKRALIVLSWTEGTPIGQIEREYSVNPYNSVAAGDIRGLAGTTRFVLRSVFGITTMAVPAAAPDPGAMEALLFELDLGVPHSTLFLAECHLSRDEIMTVLRAGFVSAEVLEAASDEDLQRRLDPEIIKKLRFPK